MRWFLGAALLMCCVTGQGRGEAPRLPQADGTLLFLENCSSVVEWSTRGEIAHVALVFRDADEPWVYEATPAKVRRVTLAEYELELGRINRRRDADKQVRAFALAPKTDYSSAEASQMKKYLDEQIGSRYTVKDYLRDKPSAGFHCAELASSTLNQSGRYAFEDCHKIHPRTLYEAVAPTHQPPQPLAIEPLAVRDPWTIRARRGASGWFTWCGWSCREAWAFVW